MWWFLKKIKDDEAEILYAYGVETKKLTGEIRYDKVTGKIEVKKLAENDTIKRAEWFLPHVYSTIFDENTPEERLVAIG